jgi:hypothetical protein
MPKKLKPTPRGPDPILEETEKAWEHLTTAAAPYPMASLIIRAAKARLRRDIAYSKIPPDQRYAKAPELCRGTVEKILEHPVARKTYDRLVDEGCGAAWLQSWLTEPVKPDRRRDDAESRRKERNSVKALQASLEKAARLARELGESRSYLHAAIVKVARQVVPATWFLPIFNLREYQQFRLVEYIREQTRRPRYADASTLIQAVYTFRGIPERELPDENTLKKLVARYKEAHRRRS